MRTLARDELAAIVQNMDHAHAWTQYLISVKVNGLDDLLAMKSGRLEPTSPERLAAIKEVGEHANAHGPAKLQALEEDACASAFVKLLSLAKAREPMLLQAMQAAAGLKKGTSGLLQEEELWAWVRRQNAGRAFKDGERPSADTVRRFWEGLHDANGRRLADVDLRKVKSAEAQTAGEKKKEDGEEDGQEAEKGGKKPFNKKGFRHAIVLTFRALAAVGTTELLAPRNGSDGGSPLATGRQGLVELDKAQIHLDISLPECHEACHYVLEKTAPLDADAAEHFFVGYWATVKRLVAWNGDHRLGLAGALEGARLETEQSAEVAARVLSASAKTSPGKGGQPPGGGGPPEPTKKQRQRANKKQRETAEAKAAKGTAAAAEDEEAAPTKKARRSPNSTGEICGNWRATGECPYGARCIHRHLKDRKNDKSADERD